MKNLYHHYLLRKMITLTPWGNFHPIPQSPFPLQMNLAPSPTITDCIGNIVVAPVHIHSIYFTGLIFICNTTTDIFPVPVLPTAILLSQASSQSPCRTRPTLYHLLASGRGSYLFGRSGGSPPWNKRPPSDQLLDDFLTKGCRCASILGSSTQGILQLKESQGKWIDQGGIRHGAIRAYNGLYPCG